jgi:hypothetical protein
MMPHARGRLAVDAALTLPSHVRVPVALSNATRRNAVVEAKTGDAPTANNF